MLGTLTTLIKLDKIASVARTANLTHEVHVSHSITAERGNVLIVEALEEKSVYGELELESGRMARIIKGDIIAGVLGERQALKGFVVKMMITSEFFTVSNRIGFLKDLSSCLRLFLEFLVFLFVLLNN